MPSLAAAPPSTSEWVVTVCDWPILTDPLSVSSKADNSEGRVHTSCKTHPQMSSWDTSVEYMQSNRDRRVTFSSPLVRNGAVNVAVNTADPANFTAVDDDWQPASSEGSPAIISSQVLQHSPSGFPSRQASHITQRQRQRSCSKDASDEKSRSSHKSLQSLGSLMPALLVTARALVMREQQAISQKIEATLQSRSRRPSGQATRTSSGKTAKFDNFGLSVVDPQRAVGTFEENHFASASGPPAPSIQSTQMVQPYHFPVTSVSSDSFQEMRMTHMQLKRQVGNPAILGTPRSNAPSTGATSCSGSLSASQFINPLLPVNEDGGGCDGSPHVASPFKNKILPLPCNIFFGNLRL